MSKKIVIGSRGSALALAQSRHIQSALARHWPELNITLVIIKTAGDAWALQKKATPATGKGMFTGELEEALRRGKIDLAIHSLKDLPTEMAADLTIAAVPKRADARDVLLLKRPEIIPAVIATGSLRRSLQLQQLWPATRTVDLRGNIDTRLRKLWENKAWDGLILAAAGLHRLQPDMTNLHLRPFSWREMLPAPGQGALALQTRSADRSLQKICRVLHDVKTAAAVLAERTFLSALGGGCQSPVGALAMMRGTALTLRGSIYTARPSSSASPDSFSLTHYVHVAGVERGDMTHAKKIGAQLARKLLHE